MFRLTQVLASASVEQQAAYPVALGFREECPARVTVRL